VSTLVRLDFLRAVRYDMTTNMVDATMVAAAAVLCRTHCWGPGRVIAHAEWRQGKIDPVGIGMDALRDLIRQAL
jgi:hypothetical protein